MIKKIILSLAFLVFLKTPSFADNEVNQKKGSDKEKREKGSRGKGKELFILNYRKTKKQEVNLFDI